MLNHDPAVLLSEMGDIPEHMHDALVAYIVQRVPPGGFLTAVLENNLMNAFGRADNENRRALFAYTKFLYNHAAISCYGSPEKVNAWLNPVGQENIIS